MNELTIKFKSGKIEKYVVPDKKSVLTDTTSLYVQAQEHLKLVFDLKYIEHYEVI